MKSWGDEYRKFVKKTEVLAKLENTASPDQVANFALTLLQGLTKFKENIVTTAMVDEESKKPMLENISKLIETAGDQHEIYSMVPVARSSVDGQRKDDTLRMARLKVKTFDGDYKAWKSWYEQYLTSIHNNEVYRNPQIKLMYLNECLSGDPLELVSGFEVTAENYPHALKALSDRYSNPQLTYVAYRKELEMMAPAEDSVMSLHTTVNKIRSILSNLRSYGIEEAEDDLRSLMVQKFDVSIVMEAYSFGKLPFTCRTEDLLSAVSERVMLREWVETLRAGKNSVSELQSTASTAMMANCKLESAELKSGKSSGGGKIRSRKRYQACVYCNGNHKADRCRQVDTVKSRKEFVTRSKRCFICLDQGHTSTVCPARGKCSRCNIGYHHLSLCMGKIEAGGSKAKNGPLSNKTGKSNGGETALGKYMYSTFLQTVVCDILAEGKALTVRGLLDTGSDSSYIEISVLQRLGVELGPLRTMSVQGFGSTLTTSVQVQETSVVLGSRINNWKQSFTVFATICLAGKLRVAPPASAVANLLETNLQYADPTLFNGGQMRIELLIGNDLYYEIVKLNGNRRLDNGLVLLNSVFGWIPAGKAYLGVENLFKIDKRALVSTEETRIATNSVECLKEVSSLLQKLWDLESLGIRVSEFGDVSAAVIEHFHSTCRIENGRYVVCWPWKGPKVDLNIPTNYRLCVARLKGTLKSTSKELLRQCDEKFREQLSEGIIEKVTSQSCYAQHYLPYKVVQREGKIRIVYDASARTKSGQCLNDFLHAGPSMTKSLVGILMNFRLGKIGLSADVEKAFHMVGLDVSDRDVTRFLWVEDYTQPEKSRITVFRFQRVPFGVVSSPFLLNMVLQDLFAGQIEKKKKENSRIYEVGRSSFYVDNLVMSVNSVEEAEQVYRCLTSLLQSAGMNLRDWTSNSQEFNKSLPAESVTNGKETVSILGMQWNKTADSLSLHFNPVDEVLSKRLLLSAVAQVYDPLGLVAPCMLALKLFLQNCWVKGMLWDDPIPSEMEAPMRKLLSQREEIRKISISRRLWTSSSVQCTFTLHVFSDASRKAYGCVIYLVKENPFTGLRCSGLLYTKQRLAPCKQQSTDIVGNKTVRPRSKQARRRAARLLERTMQTEQQVNERTIPQLELLGASIGVRTIKMVSSELHEREVKVEHTYLWTDSTTVLYWLHSTAVLPQFVENRLKEIRSTPSLTVRYVPTKDNPADCLTRGKLAGELQRDMLWWYGPGWLTSKERCWPSAPGTTPTYTCGSTTALLSSLVTVSATSLNLSLLSDNLEKRYLHWDCYVRTFSNLRKAIFGKNMPKYDSVQEMKQSEIALLRALQLKYFLKEILQIAKGFQPNAQLGLFVDDDGLIRCRGRIQHADLPWEAIHPILLPRKSRLVDVLLNTIHRQNLHIGAAHLLAKFREKFWIEKGRAKTNSIIKRCKWCRRVTGGPYKTPPMPALPRVRVADVAAFVHIGLDCFGPFNVSIQNSDKLEKTYGIIFTCLVTRAIHLELVENLSGDQFLMAFIRFTSRRGTPSFIVSDNGKNFVFAQPLVSKRINMHEMKILNNDIQSYFLTRRIHWSFIPALTPWYGGVYERLIGSVKVSIRKAIGSKLISFLTLQTVFCKVEDLVNSRPLTYVSSEDTLLPLTPNHFLRLRNADVTGDVEFDLSSLSLTAENLVTAVKRVNSAVKTFREMFFSHYLLALRQTHGIIHRKVKGSVPFAATPGTAVLIKDGLAPRPRWPMGVIEKTDARGATAHVRINTVEGEKVKSQIVQRPVSRLYPFELPSKTAYQTKKDDELVRDMQSSSAATGSTKGVEAPSKEDTEEESPPHPKRQRRLRRRRRRC